MQPRSTHPWLVRKANSGGLQEGQRTVRRGPTIKVLMRSFHGLPICSAISVAQSVGRASVARLCGGWALRRAQAFCPVDAGVVGRVR